MTENHLDLDRYPIADDTNLQSRIPVIDIKDIIQSSSGESADSNPECVDQIAQACREWGFFQIINHGISENLIHGVYREMKIFFAQAQSVKQEILRTRDNPWGYYNNELTKNQRDKKEVFDFTTPGIDPIYHASNRWPSGSSEFESVMVEYLEACTRLSLSLLEIFCMGLKLEPTFMHPGFKGNHTGFVRLNYYPVKDPMASSSIDHLVDADLGVHHHTDAGALTLLLQDEVGGLQVFREGHWFNVPPVPGAIVVNTGDMMQVWSNDQYQAAIHRVLAMESRDRYSIPFFFNPSVTTEVSPLPSTVTEKTPARYRTIPWKHFRGQRTDGDYADYGTEIQIQQYRI